MMKLFFQIAALWFLAASNCVAQNNRPPRIVNIINFVRQLEPRDSSITEEVLYETVREEVNLLRRYGMRGTFLLQYDALANPRYQSLLKEEMARGTEVGGWWEITQPHVEAAGMEWRGRYPWDWHADVGFAIGYAPEERERLVDVYMEKFKEVFGKYPASVGSWFIDAHTLGYMHRRYGIVASCTCRDQYGTDGYTLWGGYWNQAYYPSRINGYMPAQTEEGQIRVPVFRMLGSDPIYQYDTGLGEEAQGVITLEPAWPAGRSGKWVRCFFKSIFEDPCIGFNYTQAGQENSFTWAGIRQGLELQFPLLDSLAQAGRIRIETLEESGRWFGQRYRVTPPTAVAMLDDPQGRGNRTLWFDSRFYRANLLWDERHIRFRDIHLFDERIESDYYRQRSTSSQCVFTTCPIVDGFLWSTPQERAAMRLYAVTDGEEREVTIGSVVVAAEDDSLMQLRCTSDDGAAYTITLSERHIGIEGTARRPWRLKLEVAAGKTLPLKVEDGRRLTGRLKGNAYGVVCLEGKMEQRGNSVSLTPEEGRLTIDCSERHGDVRRFIGEHLRRTVKVCPRDTLGFIGLPRPYSVPSLSGAFQQDMFYWDTYFTNIGLLRDGAAGQALDNVDNILYLIERFGFVPNGSNTSYLNRSQPPMASMMVRDIYDTTRDKAWLEAACRTLEKEYAFWMTRRMAPTGLNRYGTSAARDELLEFDAYMRTRLAALPALADTARLLERASHLLAEAESGWDFSPRFGLRCGDFNPIDLNANLYRYEQNFAYFYRELGKEGAARWQKAARRRRALIERYCYNPTDGCFYDYDYVNGRLSPIYSAAVFNLMAAGALSRRQARSVVACLHRLECPCGVAACERGERSRTYQWDYPNAWASCNVLAVMGLDRYGFGQEARRIAAKYVDSITRIYRATGNLWEKYNAERGNLEVNNEYEMPPFMGWTAGAFIYASDYLCKP